MSWINLAEKLINLRIIDLHLIKKSSKLFPTCHYGWGRAYDFDSIKKWLEHDNFRSVSLTHLKRSPGFSFITAYKKGPALN